MKLSRPAFLSALSTLALQPRPPAIAAPPRACEPAQLQAALVVLDRVDGLIASPSGWAEASSLLDQEVLLTRLPTALDACTAQPTAKDKLMNNAAFIVYYEEARYGDNRLEPQEPGLRAKQNGYRREALTAVDELRTELRFLMKQKEVDREDIQDLASYSERGRRALRQYTALLQSES